MQEKLRHRITTAVLSETDETMRKHDRRRGREQEPDDRELFARFREGDDSAFLELFDRHSGRIGRYCYRIIGDSERTDDIVQDVWIRLMRFRDTDTVIHNPIGLLYKIARDRSLNHVRDSRHHVPLQLLTESDHPTGEQRELSRMEEAVILALEQLPEQQRDILILHAYSDYTFEEIAEMMGESHGAVRTKAWRARGRLRRIIAAIIEFDEQYSDE